MEPAAPSPKTTEQAPRWKRLGRRLLLAVAGGVIALIVGGIAGLLIGAVLGHVFATDHDEFISIRDWTATVCAVGGAVWVVSSFLGMDLLLGRLEKRMGGRRVSEQLVVRANIALAIGLGLAFYQFGFYDRVVAHPLVLGLLVAVGLPVLGWLLLDWGDKERVLKTWATFSVTMLILISVEAVGDANRLQYHNCWQIRDSGSESIWECAPGKSNPHQWLDLGEEGGSSRSCTEERRTSSGGTIWACETENF